MRNSSLKFAVFVTFIAAALILARYFGVVELVKSGSLRESISGYGVWAPAIFVLFYTLSTCLLLPGLPVTFLGGALFGPVWGSVYVAAGATLGAALAFLIARYLGRDIAKRLLRGKRLNELYEKTGEQGWKIVAFTRLVPLFPYTVLNYAFGLTKISFTHYIAASFVFMLPGIVAYVVFSSSILDLVSEGRLSSQLVLGLVLIAMLAFLPFVYRRMKRGA